MIRLFKTMSESNQVATLYSLVGVIIGAIIAYLFSSSDSSSSKDGPFTYFYIFSGISAYALAYVFWRLCIVRGKSYGMSIAVLVGTGMAAVSHYVCWVLLSVSYKKFGFSGAGLNKVLEGNLFFTLVSYYFTGWITFPAAIAISLYFMKKRIASQKSPPF